MKSALATGARASVDEPDEFDILVPKVETATDIGLPMSESLISWPALDLLTPLTTLAAPPPLPPAQTCLNAHTSSEPQKPYTHQQHAASNSLALQPRPLAPVDPFSCTIAEGMTKKQRALAKVQRYVQMELLVKQQQQLQQLLRLQHDKQQRLLAEQWSNQSTVEKRIKPEAPSSVIKTEAPSSVIKAEYDDSLDAMMFDTLPIDVDADNGSDSSWSNLV
jgi:hypothetical protein